MFNLQQLENELVYAARWLLADKDQRRSLHYYRVQKMKFERLRRDFVRKYADFVEHVHVISPSTTGSDSYSVQRGWSYRAPRDAVIRRDPGYEWAEGEARSVARIVGKYLGIFRHWLRENRALVHHPASEWHQLTRDLPNTAIDSYYWVQLTMGDGEWAEPPRT